MKSGSNTQVTLESKETKEIKQTALAFDWTCDSTLIAYQEFYAKPIEKVIEEFIAEPTKNYVLSFRMSDPTNREKNILKQKYLELEGKAEKYTLTEGECVFLSERYPHMRDARHLTLEKLNELFQNTVTNTHAPDPTLLAVLASHQLYSSVDEQVINGWELCKKAAELGSGNAYNTMNLLKGSRNLNVTIQAELKQMEEKNGELYLLQESANRGARIRLYDLGEHYIKNKNVKENLEKATEYHTLAAKQGCHQSMYALVNLAIEQKEFAKAAAYVGLIRSTEATSHYSMSVSSDNQSLLQSKIMTDPEVAYHLITGEAAAFSFRDDKQVNSRDLSDMHAHMLTFFTQFPSIFNEIFVRDDWDKIEPLFAENQKALVKQHWHDVRKNTYDTIKGTTGLYTDLANLVLSYTGFFKPTSNLSEETSPEQPKTVLKK